MFLCQIKMVFSIFQKKSRCAAHWCRAMLEFGSLPKSLPIPALDEQHTVCIWPMTWGSKYKLYIAEKM